MKQLSTPDRRHGCRWRPDRFMPGGEYDKFDEELRLFRVRMACLCAATCFFL